MTPEALAALHARAFAGQGRAWRAGEFRDLLSRPQVFLVGQNDAFALGQVAVDEAELLTIAVAPGQRRRGLGAAMLAAFEEAAREHQAARALLDVAADNEAALGLYSAAGYGLVARRPAYYARHCAEPVDALVLEKHLRT